MPLFDSALFDGVLFDTGATGGGGVSETGISNGNALDFGATNTTRYHTFTGPDIPVADWCIAFWFQMDDMAAGGTGFQYLLSNGNLFAANTINIFVQETNSGSSLCVVSANNVSSEMINHAQTVAWPKDGTKYLGILQRRAGNYEIHCIPKGATSSTPATGALALANVIPSGTWYFGARADLNTARFFLNPAGEVSFLTNDSLSNAEVVALAAGKHITEVRGNRALDLRFRADNASEADLSGKGRHSTRQGTGYALVAPFFDEPNIGITVHTATVTTGVVAIGGTLVLNKPAGMAVRDYWVVLLEDDDSAIALSGVTPPAGWTQIQGELNSTVDGASAWCFVRQIDGTEGATASFVPAHSGMYLAGLSVRVSGAASINTSSSQAINTGAATLAPSGGSTTTTVNNCTLLWLACTDFQADGTAVWTAPENYTGLTSYDATLGTRSNLALAYKYQNLAGTETSAGSVTLNGSTLGGAMSFRLAFVPAPQVYQHSQFESSATETASFTSNSIKTRPGSTLYVFVAYNYGLTVSLTDNKGNSYSFIGTQGDRPAADSIGASYRLYKASNNIGGDNHTFSLTVTGGTNTTTGSLSGYSIFVTEVLGDGGMDVSPTLVTDSAAPYTASITTLTNKDLILCYSSSDTTSFSGSFTTLLADDGVTGYWSTSLAKVDNAAVGAYSITAASAGSTDFLFFPFAIKAITSSLILKRAVTLSANRYAVLTAGQLGTGVKPLVMLSSGQRKLRATTEGTPLVMGSDGRLRTLATNETLEI